MNINEFKPTRSELKKLTTELKCKIWKSTTSCAICSARTGT